MPLGFIYVLKNFFKQSKTFAIMSRGGAPISINVGDGKDVFFQLAPLFRYRILYKIPNFQIWMYGKSEGGNLVDQTFGAKYKSQDKFTNFSIQSERAFVYFKQTYMGNEWTFGVGDYYNRGVIFSQVSNQSIKIGTLTNKIFSTFWYRVEHPIMKFNSIISFGQNQIIFPCIFSAKFKYSNYKNALGFHFVNNTSLMFWDLFSYRSNQFHFKVGALDKYLAPLDKHKIMYTFKMDIKDKVTFNYILDSPKEIFSAFLHFDKISIGGFLFGPTQTPKDIGMKLGIDIRIPEVNDPNLK